MRANKPDATSMLPHPPSGHEGAVWQKAVFQQFCKVHFIVKDIP
jgi:hypothetical protein